MSFKALLITALAFWPIFASGPAQAAQDLDEAVLGIAERFLATHAPDDPTRVVAVLPFRQSDGRTTQFTGLVWTTLQGALTQNSDGRFRLIEQAQVESVIETMLVTGTPIYDSDTTAELGNFLGADTLILGDITAELDSVRLDTRMIDIATGAAIEYAFQRVPLTPTVQNQLTTTTVLYRPQIAGDGPDPRSGIWRGTGSCGEATIGLALAIFASPEDTLTALQTYYPPNRSNGRGAQSGVLEMAGTFNPSTNEFNLIPGNWLFQPEGHTALGITGILDPDNGVISARYDQEGCGEVKLRRID